MHPVLNWLCAAGLRAGNARHPYACVHQVLAAADVMSLTLLRMRMAALALGVAVVLLWPGEARAATCLGQIEAETSITGRDHV